MKIQIIIRLTAFLIACLCVRLHAGQVIGWGSNISGEATGVPGPACSTGVVTSAGQVLDNVTAIAAGGYHCLALRADGTVVGWGFNLVGQANGCKIPDLGRTNGPVIINGCILSNVVAIAAGENHSLALKSDGTVVAWGDNRFGQSSVPIGLSNITAIAAGGNGSLALKRDGTVTGWGEINIPTGLSDVVAIAASSDFNGSGLALRRDGTVVEWQVHGVLEPQVVQGLSNVVAIATGANHSLALKRNGTVFGWGDNGSGGATGIATTGSASVTNGLVTIDRAILSNVVAIAAGNGYSLALKKDGTVVTWGKPHRTRINDVWLVPPGLSNVVAIAAGNKFCLAITTNSAVADKFRQK